MKKSIGKKLLAGIVCASMILGIPVSGYSQEEEAQIVIAAEEAAETAEAVLAGAETAAEVQAPEETVEAPAQEAAPDALDEAPDTEEEAVLDVEEDAEDALEEELFVAEEEEEPAEDLEDGILLEAAEEDEEEAALEAASGTITEVASYAEFQKAILQAKDGDTIRLTANISYTSGSITIDKEQLKDANSITIDLNKKKLKIDSSYWFYVKDGKNVTIKDGTLEGSLNVVGATVNIPEGTEVVEAFCLKISEGGTVNVDGGTLSSTIGTDTRSVEVEKGTLNLNKGSLFKLTLDGRTGIHLMDSGAVVNVTEATIDVTGDGDGVLVDGGTFEIKKGTVCTSIKTKGNAITLGENDGKNAKIIINGTQDTTRIISQTGYAVYEALGDSYGSIAISGGYLKGLTGDIKCTHKENIVKVTTDAVGFAHTVDRKYLPNVNCRADKKNADGVYVIRTLNADNAAAAYIRDGKTYYTDTLKEAMTVVSETYSPKTGDTVKLFKDITPDTTDEKTVSVGINRTIDLNKHLLRTDLTVKGCTVTIKNGTLQAYSTGKALTVDEGADVTLDSSLTVKAPDGTGIFIGGDGSKTYKLTVKCPVIADTYAIFIEEGKCTVAVDSAKLTTTGKGSVIRASSKAKDAKLTINKCTITGLQGIHILAGECTITDSAITGTEDQAGDPEPGTVNTGSAIAVGATGTNAKLIIKSGTFTSEKGNALYIEVALTGCSISGGTFRSKRDNWDAVAGKAAANMITGGTYYPNKKNAIKDSVDTSKCALVGVTDGIFYAAAYDKVMSTLYAANASATKFTVGAAATGKTITGCKDHTAFLNLSGNNVSMLVGTDDKIAKNKGTLPSTANTEAWIFHNDLVKLTKTANAKAACTTPAVTADCWYCDTLKKAYKAADAKEEVDAGTIKEAAKGHKWSGWNANGDRTCSVCGAKEHDASKAQPAYQISGKPSGLKVKSTAARKLTISWKKPAASKLKKIKGVEVQIATDKNFTNIVKTKKVKKSKTSVTVKLKKKTKYYVRIRYYKGSKISRWRGPKAKKTK